MAKTFEGLPLNRFCFSHNPCADLRTCLNSALKDGFKAGGTLATRSGSATVTLTSNMRHEFISSSGRKGVVKLLRMLQSLTASYGFA
jgi:hypothetical protein